MKDIATKALNGARKHGWKIATAESCTGGLISGALTEIAGSSDVFDRGFVTQYPSQALRVRVDQSTNPKVGSVLGSLSKAQNQRCKPSSLARWDATRYVTIQFFMP